MENSNIQSIISQDPTLNNIYNDKELLKRNVKNVENFLIQHKGCNPDEVKAFFDEALKTADVVGGQVNNDTHVDSQGSNVQPIDNVSIDADTSTNSVIDTIPTVDESVIEQGIVDSNINQSEIAQFENNISHDDGASIESIGTQSDDGSNNLEINQPGIDAQTNNGTGQAGIQQPQVNNMQQYGQVGAQQPQVNNMQQYGQAGMQQPQVNNMQQYGQAGMQQQYGQAGMQQPQVNNMQQYGQAGMQQPQVNNMQQYGQVGMQQAQQFNPQPNNFQQSFTEAGQGDAGTGLPEVKKESWLTKLLNKIFKKKSQ